MQCRRAVGPIWSMSPKTCKLMYTTEMGNPNRNPCSKQALALRMMSGAIPSTPFIALNTSDIILFLRSEAAKLEAYGSLTPETIAYRKGTIKTHAIINTKFVVDLNIPPREERDLSIRTMMLGQHFTVTTPGADNMEYTINISSETITCYTHGSHTDSGSGAGYIIIADNDNTTIEEKSFKPPDCCTVYQTELTVIIEACKYVSTYTNTHINIWSNSLSSIQAISSLSARSRTTKDCYESLNALGSTNTLEIRSRSKATHIGLWGNEKADELAKLGHAWYNQSINF